MSNTANKQKREIEVLYSQSQIAEAVKRLGEEITRDYEGLEPLFVGVLKGSFVFMADLIRAVDLPSRVDFITAKSYGENTVSSGFVRIVNDVEEVIEGRHVIVVEDILETGNTLSSVCEVLRSRNPASLKVCAFLDKEFNRKIQFYADYHCFTLEEDSFVIGYGLDYAERYRNLPYLGVLKD
ncbi:MAG: hypoxanthine phosphoribosyltransferase [Oscillospiraceae bacterium]|nr:hypoxanthine phosphoribosyltransferase [Oscillospiraceae bacterium]